LCHVWFVCRLIFGFDRAGIGSNRVERRLGGREFGEQWYKYQELEWYKEFRRVKGRRREGVERLEGVRMVGQGNGLDAMEVWDGKYASMQVWELGDLAVAEWRERITEAFTCFFCWNSDV
jgi:hypothetical protein